MVIFYIYTSTEMMQNLKHCIEVFRHLLPGGDLLLVVAATQ